MFKRMILTIALVACSWAGATVYYVDATTGLDSDTGQSEALAWQTINKVNTSSFSQDDQILFKRGEVWREMLTCPSSGASDHPIIFGAYGTGALPKILGSTAITTWTETEEGSHLWTAAHTWVDTLHMQADDTPVATENGPCAVFIDGVRGIIDATPDTDGEWTFADSTITLYSVADPDTRSVEMATRDCGIWTAAGDNKDYITIQDIEIAYAGWCGILQGYESTNWTVSGCTVHHIGYEGTRDEHGINSRSEYMTVTGCTVYQCGSNGINYSDDYGDYMVFTGNTVYDCHHSMINQLTSAGGANNCEISRNIVYLSAGFTSTQTGMTGIYFGQGGDTSTICAYNLVYDTAGPGITIEADATTAVVENNTVYGGGTASIFTKTTHGLTLRNNIAVNIGGSSNYCYRDTTASDNTVDYNNWYSSGAADAYFLNKNDVPYAPTSGARTFTTWKTDTSDDTNSIITSPAFKDSANKIFYLARTSGAINVGVNTGYSTDILGVAVPVTTNYDMGAYEYTPLTVAVEEDGDQDDPTNTLPIVFDVTFSEAVTGFAIGDVTMGGTATGVTAEVAGSGAAYTISVTAITGDGTVIPSLAVDIASGVNGNTNAISTSSDATVTYDTADPAAPVITGISDDTGTASDEITSDTTLHVIGTAEASSIVELFQDGVTKGTTNADGSGDWDFDYTATTLTEGTYSFTAKAMDAATNESVASTALPVEIDTTAPDVTVEQDGDQIDPATDLPILFDIVFSEAVTGFAYGDITFTGTATVSAGSVSGSGTTYVLSVTGASTEGTVQPTIAASKAIDIVGIANTESTSTDNSVGYAVVPLADLIDLVRALQVSVAAVKAKTDLIPASPAAVGSAMTLTSAYDAAKTASAQTSVDILADPVSVNQYYGATSADPYPLAARSGGKGVSGVMITAYLKSEYDLGVYIPKGTTITDSAGFWTHPMLLDRATYMLVYSGTGFAKVVTVEVE